MNTSVLLFEDNKELRESIEALINSSNDLLLLGSYPNALNAAKLCLEFNPDIILMDIDMPGISGIEAVKQIRKVHRDVLIIMLTVFEDSEHVLNAIFAGASGYLLKKHLSDKLESSIQEVLSGGAPMSPGVARLVITNMQVSVKGKDYGLTDREREILRSLSEGCSYKIISQKLFISLDTVRSHIKNIYRKLHVHSQTEAVSKALNEKII